MKIKTTKGQILHLLRTEADTRDSDSLLLARVWKSELGNTTFMTGSRLLSTIAEGKLTSPESIRRARQKIQQGNPELRGTNYYSRHKEQESVKQELREWDEDGNVKDQLNIFSPNK